MEDQEKKCQSITDELKKMESTKATENDSMNALTSQLTEANNKVTELEKMFSSMETQLKKSQEIQSQKDKEIQVQYCREMDNQISSGNMLMKGNKSAC